MSRKILNYFYLWLLFCLQLSLCRWLSFCQWLSCCLQLSFCLHFFFKVVVFLTLFSVKKILCSAGLSWPYCGMRDGCGYNWSYFLCPFDHLGRPSSGCSTPPNRRLQGWRKVHSNGFSCLECADCAHTFLRQPFMITFQVPDVWIYLQFYILRKYQKT